MHVQVSIPCKVSGSHSGFGEDSSMLGLMPCWHTGDTPRDIIFLNLMLYLTDTYQQEIHVSTFNVHANMKFD